MLSLNAFISSNNLLNATHFAYFVLQQQQQNPYFEIKQYLHRVPLFVYVLALDKQALNAV